MTRTDTRQDYRTETQQSGQMVVYDAEVVGTFAEPDDVNARIDKAQRAGFHLVAPAPQVGELPLGCKVAVNVVHIDPDLDTYRIEGKLGLAKPALQRIGAAAGVSWDVRQSGRLDDGRDPMYCRWRAVGTVRHFDGTLTTIIGEKEMDLRPGSPVVEGLESRAESKGRDASRQIRELRMHIQSHAETKAQLRAIRSLGIKTSYEARELQSPFVVAKLMFTGHTDDPELRRDFARMIGASFHAGTAALYGHGAAAPPPAALPQPAAPSLPPLGTQAAPPVGTVDAEIEDAPAPALDVRIHGGDEDGRPIGEATTEALSAYADRLDSAIQAGRVRDHGAAMAALDACLAEMDRRRGPAEEIY